MHFSRISMATESRDYFLARKTIAQAMLDIGMFTEHAKRLKQEIQEFHSNEKSYATVMIGLIILSLILQVLVGFLLAMNRHFEKIEGGIGRAFTVNDWLLTAVICIVCLNCFILAFE